jgi:hypothetical protein
MSQLIQIRIRNLDPDPDPGKRKVDTQKRRKKYCFKELDILSGGLEAALWSFKLLYEDLREFT